MGQQTNTDILFSFLLSFPDISFQKLSFPDSWYNADPSRNEETNSAVINLKDIPDKEWHSFFQGSQGGHTSEYRIVKTFLQPDYTGEWIDFIEIWHNGEPAFEMYEHFCLYEKYERGNIGEYFSY